MIVASQAVMSDYAREYIASIGSSKSGVIDILTNQGEQRLNQYVRGFAENHSQSLQSRDDLVRIAAGQTRRLFGVSLAEALAARLRRLPVVLTANHHGVEYHPLYVQGTLVYALPELLGQAGALPGHVPVVPVFSFGSVSLNNATFPRGIVLPSSPKAPGTSFQKISVFPDSLKHSMVSFTPPMTASMVASTRARVDHLVQTHRLQRQVAAKLSRILEEDYLDDEVLGQSSYSDQASLLNERLWRRILGQPDGVVPPRIIYLEIEALVRDLLAQCDLDDVNSLAYRVLFDRDLRRQVLDRLKGESGCWHPSGKDRGTTFFWGVDSRGRRVSLQLEEDANSEWLIGEDWNGKAYRFRFAAMDLKQALEDGRILPGMFLCFLLVAFARGLRCFGGPWQTTYLPRMQAGLVTALRGTRGYEDWVISIAGVPTANFVAGVTVAIAGGEGCACEAGMVELLAAGGLTAADYELIGNIRVGNAILHNFLMDKSLELAKMCCTSKHPQILNLQI